MSRFGKLMMENFQSHQRTEIVFSEGFNVFVGPSDSGKSAILRALRWVLFNVPRGSEFIRAGAGQCRVVLTLVDGTEIERIRSKSGSVNRYILRLPDGTEQVFEGFGTEVPREILEAHRMHPIPLDQKEILIHFGSQLESPFLLFEPDSAKAKTIGRISGAHLIDRALKKANADRNAKNQELKQLDEQKEKIRAKLAPYDNLDELGRLLGEAKEAFARARRKKELHGRLQLLQLRLTETRESLGQVRSDIDLLMPLLKMESRFVQTEKKFFLFNQLVKVVEKRKVLLEDKERCRKWIEASDRLPVANEARERAERLLERLNGLTRLRERGKELAREKDDITHNLARLEHVREAQERFRRLEKWPDRLKKLEGLGRKWMNLRKGRAEAAAFMERYREIPILTQTVVRLEQQAERLKQLKKLRESLVDTRDRICRGRELCEEREAQIKQLVAEWATLLQQLGKCPTCGSRIDASVIDHIMEEVRGGLERAAVGRENQEDPPTA